VGTESDPTRDFSEEQLRADLKADQLSMKDVPHNLDRAHRVRIRLPLEITGGIPRQAISLRRLTSWALSRITFGWSHGV
jgi:hypothetical protein